MRKTIGKEYGARIGDREYRVTLASIRRPHRAPHEADVVIRDHSVESFLSGAAWGRRHGSDPVPVAKVKLRDLLP